MLRKLTIDCWLAIFAYLDVANLVKCKQVCKFIRDIICTHATDLQWVPHKLIELDLHTPSEMKGILDLHSLSPLTDIQKLFVPARPRWRDVSHRLRFYTNIDASRLGNILIHMEVKSIVISNYRGSALYSLLCHLSGICMEAKQITFRNCDFLSRTGSRFTFQRALKRFFKERKGHIATLKLERCIIDGSVISPLQFMECVGPLHGQYKRFR